MMKKRTFLILIILCAFYLNVFCGNGNELNRLNNSDSIYISTYMACSGIAFADFIIYEDSIQILSLNHKLVGNDLKYLNNKETIYNKDTVSFFNQNIIDFFINKTKPIYKNKIKRDEAILSDFPHLIISGYFKGKSYYQWIYLREEEEYVIEHEPSFEKFINIICSILSNINNR